MAQPFTPTSKLAGYLVAAVFALAPFHAFLTIWGATLVGHYTALRLWADALLLVLLGIAAFWLVKDAALRKWFTSSLLVRLLVAYAGLTLLLGLISLAKGDVTPKALAYGLLVNLRFLAWFAAVLLATRQSPWLVRNWPKLLLAPAVVIVVFAALQYTVLPHRFLSHFGYNAATNVAPIETIDHNPHYIRVQSTLRGANPLGAYLVVVLSGLGVLYASGMRRLLCVVFGAVAVFALYASGSRSAWIGAALSLAVIAWFRLQTRRGRIVFGIVSFGVLALAVGGFLLLKNNVSVQHAVLHTQDQSAVDVTSNEAHASAFTSGVREVINQPLGAGPGTAGPASTHNTDHSVRLAENYYVQIAQETGWLGLALFLSVLALVFAELYAQIRTSRLALMLFASLVGVSFVNLLSHAWTDNTLAYVWWGLAGIALAAPETVKTRETDA